MADLGIAPVAVVVPAHIKKNGRTPSGRKVVVCPALVDNKMTCAACGICATKRKAIIAFPAVGTGGKKIVG